LLLIILSESGCPGFEDLQDCYWLFCQNQDVQDLRIYRMLLSLHENLKKLYHLLIYISHFFVNKNIILVHSLIGGYPDG
jgi:hypothetical protein